MPRTAAVLPPQLLPLLLLLLLLPLSEQARCVKYSWLGPDSITAFGETELHGNTVNGLKISNRTCRAFPKPKPIPCIAPFVVTDQGHGVPSPDDIYKGFGEVVQCDPGEGNVCVQVGFFFSDKLVNLTAYCSRVSVVGGNPMRRGCVSAKKGDYINKVCVCDPEDPSYKFPCNILQNSAVNISIQGRTVFSILVASLTTLKHVL